MSKKIIFDTDIADDIDDAFALAFALEIKELEILGITTVYRNADMRARLAAKMVKVYERDIPVFKGIDKPIKQTYYPYYKDGKLMDKTVNGVFVPAQCEIDMESGYRTDINAVNFIIDSAKKYGKELLIVAVGPFMNIAAAIRIEPEIMSQICGIYLMGGQYFSPALECNINCCPESAHVVFSSGINIYAVGIDVTEKCAMSKQQVEAIYNMQSNKGFFLKECLNKWFDFYGFPTPVLHDPLTITAALDCDFIEFEKLFIRLESEGENRGKFYLSDKNDKQAVYINIAKSVNAPAFLKFFTKTITGI